MVVVPNCNTLLQKYMLRCEPQSSSKLFDDVLSVSNEVTALSEATGVQK